MTPEFGNLLVSFFYWSYHSSKCRYKIIREVGNGTFGSVWRALNKQSVEVVGIFFISILLKFKSIKLVLFQINIYFIRLQ